jgi:hypothetical protein
MSARAKREYVQAIYQRYWRARTRTAGRGRVGRDGRSPALIADASSCAPCRSDRSRSRGADVGLSLRVGIGYHSRAGVYTGAVATADAASATATT